MTSMRNHRLLSPDEEKELGRTIRDGSPAEAEAARRSMIEHNLRLVYKIASVSRRPDWVDVDDLAQAGMIGLMTAVDRFDPDRGFRFSTYATWWIRQAMQRCPDVAGPVKIPEPERRQALQMTDAELASSPRHLAAALARSVASLDDQSFTVSEDVSLHDVLAGGNSEDDAVNAVRAQEIREAITAALSSFERRHQDWFWMAFPLDGSKPATQRQIAEKAGVSSQAVSNQLRRMRRQVAAHSAVAGLRDAA